MARRKTTRSITRKRRTTPASRRRTTSRRNKGSDKLINFFVPLFLIVCIVSCLGLVLFFGFRSVAASSFFEIEKIETAGLRNLPKDKVEQIVRSGLAGKGVLDADLDKIRAEIGKFEYVRNVSVSRVLPQKIKVIVEERQPVGIVRINDSSYRIDRDGKLLDKVKGRTRDDSHFLMLGWNPDISDSAKEENKKRLELYMKLQEEWKTYDLSKRVVAADLTNIREVDVKISDSGESVTLSLGDRDFGRRLKEGIKHAAGNGLRVSKIILDDASPVVVYRD